MATDCAHHQGGFAPGSIPLVNLLQQGLPIKRFHDVENCVAGSFILLVGRIIRLGICTAQAGVVCVCVWCVCVGGPLLSFLEIKATVCASFRLLPTHAPLQLMQLSRCAV
jgi:hypothetical protein